MTIYGSGDFTPVWDPDAQTVTYSLPVAATLDAQGRMMEVVPGTRTSVVFGVTSILDNRWRISSLDDGIVISEANFALVYRPVEIAFASQDLEVAVPDLRWLPRRNIATYTTLALLGGPSPWLEDAVVTGIGIAAGLDVDAVPVEDGRATVALGAEQCGHRRRSRARGGAVRPDAGSPRRCHGGGGHRRRFAAGRGWSITLGRPPVPSPSAVVVVDGRVGAWDGDRLVSRRVERGATSRGGDGHRTRVGW